MDFIIGLPKSEGRNVIMVVVDRLTSMHNFAHYLIHLKQVQLLRHLWKQLKSYMETQILL